MKQLPSEIKCSILREKQSIIVLDKKGKMIRIYCQRGDVVYEISIGKNSKKQITNTIYLTDNLPS